MRAFAYHSRARDQKKEHTLQRAIAREAHAVEKRAQKLAKQVFHCVEDATAVLALMLFVIGSTKMAVILVPRVPLTPLA